MITWNEYLTEEARKRLVSCYVEFELPENNHEFISYEETISLRERIRIAHWHLMFADYTVPETMNYCVWFPEEEFPTKLFTTPVPPIEVSYFKANPYLDFNRFPQGDFHQLLSEEAALLEEHRRSWSKADSAAVYFYQHLPYIDDCFKHRRWVQWEY